MQPIVSEQHKSLVKLILYNVCLFKTHFVMFPIGLLRRKRELYFFKDVSRLCGKSYCSDSKETFKSTFLIKETKTKNLNEEYIKVEIIFLTSRF